MSHADGEPKRVGEMLGEFCREAGVLVGVFGVLDGYLHEEVTKARPLWMVVVIACSMALLTLGMIIERKRPR